MIAFGDCPWGQARQKKCELKPSKPLASLSATMANTAAMVVRLAMLSSINRLSQHLLSPLQ